MGVAFFVRTFYSQDSRMAVRKIRRRLLLGTSLALALMLAGCLGFSEDGRSPADCSNDWSPSIEANELTLAPGENATAQITATNVSGVRFQFDSDLVWWMKFNDGSVSPQHDRSTDGYPPGYYWEQCAHVEIAIPVSIPPDAEPGKYTYGVRVVQNLTGNGGSMTRNFTISVSDNDAPVANAGSSTTRPPGTLSSPEQFGRPLRRAPVQNG